MHSRALLLAALIIALMLGPTAVVHAQTATLKLEDGRDLVLRLPEPDFVSIQRDTISISDGLVTFRIPSGWELFSRTDGHIGIRAIRYGREPGAVPWAECRIILQQHTIKNGLTQEMANARFLSEESQVVAEARQKRTLREYSKSLHVGDAAVVRAVLVNLAVYGDNRQFMVVANGKILAVHADCNIMRPEHATDMSDIEAFLDSATLSRQP